jgi:hypothetical protein
MTEKPEMVRWAKRYRTALRTQLGQGPRASLRVALGLGRQAAGLGMETLDVARIHEQALTGLVVPNGTARTRQRILSRTKAFFGETIVPIEQTHAAAKADVRHVEQLGEELRERTAESSASTRRLKRGVVRRKAAETALENSGAHRSKLLEKSHRLEDRLQDQTRKMLAAQEGGRRDSSRQLQNEVAQILLAIHVRLLTLNEAIKANTKNLKKEIAETQSLVKQSVLTIKRLAHESGVHHET